MPTVILLDVSLSMCRQFNQKESSETIIDVACRNIDKLLDKFSTSCKLEYTSLVVFSSLYEVIIKFTRDYDLLKDALSTITTYDKTCIEAALQGVRTSVIQEWGTSVPVNLILITDGASGTGDGSLKESLSSINNRKTDDPFPLPFAFPCNLSIVCLSRDKMKTNQKLFEELITLNDNKGEIYFPDVLNEASVQQCFNQVINLHYSSFECSIKCGQMESDITFYPKPNFDNTVASSLYSNSKDNISIISKLKLPNSLQVIGFIDLQDFSNPPFISRHLVLPTTVSNEQIKSREKPNFCVLLHGSLKMEKMGAVVSLGYGWYGMLYSWSDHKKKANLMLSIFFPNVPFTWLGALKQLGPAYELPNIPYRIDMKDNTEETPFPVAPLSRRSYHSQSNAVWIKQSGLQSDIQKLLRYAKKLPDKQSAFFKEVNKLRRAGVIYGFHEMLNGLASTLENEGINMSTEVSVQLRHVAEGLRNASTRELNKNIIAINMFRKKSSDV